MSIYKPVILSFFLIKSVFSQYDDSQDFQKRQALKSIEIIKEIVNVISVDSTYKKLWSRELVDSICYASKTVSDFALENEEMESMKFYLGNYLNYKRHFLNFLDVSYVVLGSDLLKINFLFKFRYVSKEDTLYFYSPEKSFMDSLNLSSPLKLIFQYKRENNIAGFRCSYIIEKTLTTLNNLNNGLLFNIKVKDEDVEFKQGVDFVNDPTNHLIYGFACSVDGAPPAGLIVFAELVRNKKIYLIENLLYSYNPVTRLMAYDALGYLMKKSNYIPTNNIVKRLKEISKEKIIIEACWGCFFEEIQMKEAIKKSKNSKDNIYDSFVFIKNE